MSEKNRSTGVQGDVFILSLKQQVVFPGIRTSITIPNQTFEELCEFCEKYNSSHVGVVAVRPNSDDDEVEHLYDIGTYCRIASHSQSTTKAGDQEVTIVTLSLEGESRFQVLEYVMKTPYRLSKVKILDGSGTEAGAEVQGLMQNVQEQVMELLKDDPKDGNAPGGTMKSLFGGSKQRIRWPSSPSVLADMIGAGLPQLSVGERQQVLETVAIRNRLELVCELIRKTVEVQRLSREINHKMSKRSEDELRETVLKRQLQDLKQEMRKLKGGAAGMGDDDDREDPDEEDEEDEMSTLREALMKCGLPPAAKTMAARELKRLQSIPPHHPEYTVCRTYLETLSNLPWNSRTEDDLDLGAAQDILEKDHYGLEKVKRRILEFLAVQKMRGDMKGPILCLHGPPGVGKTSLGRSIAKALGRKFHRIALGGVRDEAELRGHRRTYIGSMPGSIMQALASLKTKNPVILLDEVDKLTRNAMFNPSGALLELLDPEQNHLFKDHYINTPFDLSGVLFLCTCNSLEPIDRPLLDRMEVIDLSGYTVEEKVHIATTHLLPKQRKLHALQKPDPKDTDTSPAADPMEDGSALSKEEQKEAEEEAAERKAAEEAEAERWRHCDEPLLSLTKVAIADLVSKYTMESGVRNLERRIAQICRWATLRLAGTSPGDAKASIAAAQIEDIDETERVNEAALAECGPDANGKMAIDARHLPHIIGPELFEPDMAERLTVGVAMGLSVSSVGGQLLFIEASRNKGSGRMTITGQLGEVMRESVSTAMSLLRSKLYSFALAADAGDKIEGEVMQELSLRGDNGKKDPFGNDDIHVHFPAGGIPKDGPSAGVATTLALASLLLGRPVRSDTAVTGEISLRGHVLPVGGIRDKVLAAHRAGVRHVLLPFANQRHVKDEIPASNISGLEIHFVKHIDEALAWVFQTAEHTKDWQAPVTDGAAPSPAFALMAKL